MPTLDARTRASRSLSELARCLTSSRQQGVEAASAPEDTADGERRAVTPRRSWLARASDRRTAQLDRTDEPSSATMTHQQAHGHHAPRPRAGIATEHAMEPRPTITNGRADDRRCVDGRDSLSRRPRRPHRQPGQRLGESEPSRRRRCPSRAATTASTLTSPAHYAEKHVEMTLRAGSAANRSSGTPTGDTHSATPTTTKTRSRTVEPCEASADPPTDPATRDAEPPATRSHHPGTRGNGDLTCAFIATRRRRVSLPPPWGCPSPPRSLRPPAA